MRPLNGVPNEADDVWREAGCCRETSPTRADTETDVDFTPASGVKQLCNIKPQHITEKPAGWTKEGAKSAKEAGKVAFPCSSLRYLHDCDLSA